MTDIQLSQPAYTLTVGELINIIRAGNQPTTIVQQQEKRPIRGIHGLAKFLGISAVTAQDLKNKKKVPYTQFGRVILFDPEKVLEALKNGKK